MTDSDIAFDAVSETIRKKNTNDIFFTFIATIVRTLVIKRRII